MATTTVSVSRRRVLARSARLAATRIGGFVERRYRPRPTRAHRKGVGDFVTETDIAAERTVRAELLGAWPTHGFIGEESAPVRADAEFVWVVDPIDGTSNYAQGLPIWSVSVACLHRGAPLVAAVYCAPEQVVYSAALGLGATRASRRLRTPRAKLDDATVVGAQWHRGELADFGFVRACNDAGARIRTFGCTVAQLCDVATGRLHANVQQQGRLWDFAAAALVVTEAGGRFTAWDGGAIFPIADLTAPRHYPSLAAAPGIHDELIRRLAVCA